MSHTNIVFAHIQQNKTENIKQIEICKKLSDDFWKCIYQHKYLENVSVNCGKYFFELSKCLNKIK
jgi:hypothetical protein